MTSVVKPTYNYRSKYGREHVKLYTLDHFYHERYRVQLKP